MDFLQRPEYFSSPLNMLIWEGKISWDPIRDKELQAANGY